MHLLNGASGVGTLRELSTSKLRKKNLNKLNASRREPCRHLPILLPLLLPSTALSLAPRSVVAIHRRGSYMRR